MINNLLIHLLFWLAMLLFPLPHLIFLGGTPSSYRLRREKARQAFVRAASVASQFSSLWLSTQYNHFADMQGVEDMPS